MTSHLLNRVQEYIELPRFAYAWELGEPDRAFAGELDGEYYGSLSAR